MTSPERHAMGLLMSWSAAQERVSFALDASPFMTARGTLTVSPDSDDGSFILLGEDDLRLTFSLRVANILEVAKTPIGETSVEIFWAEKHLSVSKAKR